MIRCPKCRNLYMSEVATTCPACGVATQVIPDYPSFHPEQPSDGTLTAIRAIAAHVTDSRLAMICIRVLLEEK